MGQKTKTEKELSNNDNAVTLENCFAVVGQYFADNWVSVS